MWLVSLLVPTAMKESIVCKSIPATHTTQKTKRRKWSHHRYFQDYSTENHFFYFHKYCMWQGEQKCAMNHGWAGTSSVALAVTGSNTIKSFGWDYEPRSLVCVHAQKDHTCRLKILQSMSEFGGLWNLQNNLHSLQMSRVFRMLKLDTIQKKRRRSSSNASASASFSTETEKSPPQQQKQNKQIPLKNTHKKH